jgi:opacity protein-like surface antigen
VRSMALALALAVVPAAAGAEASPPPRKAYLALKVAMVIPQKDADLRGFDDGFALEGAVGVRLGENLGLELEVGRLSLGRSQTALAGGVIPLTVNEDVVAYPVMATVKLVVPTRRLELYALAGAGVYFMSGELEASAPGFIPLAQKDSDTQFAFQLGGGAAFRLAPRVQLGGEVKYVTGETELFLDTLRASTSFDSLSLGVTLAFSL